MDTKEKYIFLLNKIQPLKVSASNIPQSTHFVLHIEVTNSILKNVIIIEL